MPIRRTAVPALCLALAAAGCNDDDGAASDDEAIEARAVAPAPFEGVPSTVAAGEVTLRLVNEDEMGHSFMIEELGDGVELVAAGDEGTATVELDAGTAYTYYCDVPGHRDLGMEGQFEAEG